MKINLQKISFKGYDAAPLKRIFLERSHSSNIISEMNEIGKKEDIEIKTIYDKDLKWAQDDKTIIEKDSKPVLIANDYPSRRFFREMKRLGIPSSRESYFSDGGNTFIGKKPNGEKYIIIGHKNLSQKNKEGIAIAYNIPVENVYNIPNQNFHIDMAIRPVGYPDILVNDFDLGWRNINKVMDESDEFAELFLNYKQIKKELLKEYYSTNEVCDALREYGFNPIRIGGIYSKGINFMNAIVNKHSDGTMSYITNSSETNPPSLTYKLQALFENDLREKVPNISDTYFIKGKQEKGAEYNYMTNSLSQGNGGIHCMSLEEPDFDRWA